MTEPPDEHGERRGEPLAPGGLAAPGRHHVRHRPRRSGTCRGPVRLDDLQHHTPDGSSTSSTSTPSTSTPSSTSTVEPTTSLPFATTIPPPVVLPAGPVDGSPDDPAGTPRFVVPTAPEALVPGPRGIPGGLAAAMGRLAPSSVGSRTRPSAWPRPMPRFSPRRPSSTRRRPRRPLPARRSIGSAPPTVTRRRPLRPPEQGSSTPPSPPSSPARGRTRSWRWPPPGAHAPTTGSA